MNLYYPLTLCISENSTDRVAPLKDCRYLYFFTHTRLHSCSSQRREAQLLELLNKRRMEATASTPAASIQIIDPPANNDKANATTADQDKDSTDKKDIGPF